MREGDDGDEGDALSTQRLCWRSGSDAAACVAVDDGDFFLLATGRLAVYGCTLVVLVADGSESSKWSEG